VPAAAVIGPAMLAVILIGVYPAKQHWLEMEKNPCVEWPVISDDDIINAYCTDRPDPRMFRRIVSDGIFASFRRY
jgi:hypothetical protein